MTDREQKATRMRALLDAAEILIVEANRNVPGAEPTDTQDARDAILAMHANITSTLESIRVAKLKSYHVVKAKL